MKTSGTRLLVDVHNISARKSVSHHHLFKSVRKILVVKIFCAFEMFMISSNIIVRDHVPTFILHTGMKKVFFNANGNGI